ncbi:MAG: hypothetical protein ACOY3X_05695 [Pseudomonadota bacterium]
MKAIVLAFLLQLEAIGATDPAMYDMNVLAAVHQPIHAAVVEGRGDVTVPARFGLSSASSEQQLHAAVDRFIQEARASREYAAARTADARIDLLFADGTVTPAGHAYDDYFAFTETN